MGHLDHRSSEWGMNGPDRGSIVDLASGVLRSEIAVVAWASHMGEEARRVALTFSCRHVAEIPSLLKEVAFLARM